MLSYNRNNEHFYLPMYNANILDESRTEKDYLSYEPINQNSTISINIENSYNLFPIFHSEEEKKSNNTFDEEKNEKEKNDLYFLYKKDIPKKSSIKFISKNHLKKKRGKKKQNEINENEDNGYIKIKIHDKNTSDNVLRKIQVHYLSFIVSFINEILYNLKFNQRFFKLSYSFKKNTKKEFVNSLKTKDIGEILCNKISDKYKKDENVNKNIYNKIKEDKVLKNIFSEKYLLLFKKVYFKSNKLINLSEYGLNKIIKLSDKVKMFQDLLNDIEKLDINKKYKKNINDCAVQRFFPNPLFKIE